MTPKTEPNALQFLQAFKPIASKVQQLQRLNEWFKVATRSLFKVQYQIANYRDGCLILVTDNASNATQIRLHLPELLSLCRQHEELRGLKMIQCKVSPPIESSTPKAKTRAPQLSSDSARLILDSISTLKDRKLQEIMERIARRGLTNSNE